MASHFYKIILTSGFITVTVESVGIGVVSDIDVIGAQIISTKELQVSKLFSVGITSGKTKYKESLKQVRLQKIDGEQQ